MRDARRRLIHNGSRRERRRQVDPFDTAERARDDAAGRRFLGPFAEVVLVESRDITLSLEVDLLGRARLLYLAASTRVDSVM